MAIRKIYIDSSAESEDCVRSFCSRIAAPAETVENSKIVFKDIYSAEDPVQRGKEILYLTKNKGAFIRECPGTRHYTCCGYQILHIASFCSMDCSYCILQAYFHPPALQYFVNHSDMFDELSRLFSEKRIRRIGTGEFTDSLIWENLTGQKTDGGLDVTCGLIDLFSKQSHAVLELKTKTSAADHLLNLSHNRKTILSWSLNTPEVIRTEERYTAPLAARLKAAAKCESAGYPIAFHFDPLILYDGCEADYEKVIGQMFSHVSPDNIVWISLGTFRFLTELKPIIRKRFPKSKIIYGEFIRGSDNKMRYFKPLRLKLYQTILSRIKEIAPNTTVYFCMEDNDIWKNALGFLPEDFGGLPAMLDKSAMSVCDLH